MAKGTKSKSSSSDKMKIQKRGIEKEPVKQTYAKVVHECDRVEPKWNPSKETLKKIEQSLMKVLKKKASKKTRRQTRSVNKLADLFGQMSASEKPKTPTNYPIMGQQQQ